MDPVINSKTGILSDLSRTFGPFDFPTWPILDDGPICRPDPICRHDGPICRHDGPIFCHDGPIFCHDRPIFRHDGLIFWANTINQCMNSLGRSPGRRIRKGT